MSGSTQAAHKCAAWNIAIVSVDGVSLPGEGEPDERLGFGGTPRPQQRDVCYRLVLVYVGWLVCWLIAGRLGGSIACPVRHGRSPASAATYANNALPKHNGTVLFLLVALQGLSRLADWRQAEGSFYLCRCGERVMAMCGEYRYRLPPVHRR